MGQKVTQGAQLQHLCRSAARLLETRDYQHGAEVLRQALVASERSGAWDCASYLELAFHVASACRLCHSEAK